MIHIRTLLAAGAAVLAMQVIPAASLAASPETKQLIDSAKSAGIIGEQADGYLGFVNSAADPVLRQAVAEINAGRAQVYREAAAKSGAPPEAAGASAFINAIMPRLKPGQYYRPNDAGWLRK